MNNWRTRDKYNDFVIDLRQQWLPEDIYTRVLVSVSHEALPSVSGYKIYLRLPWDIDLMKALMTDHKFQVHHARQDYVLLYKDTGLPEYFNSCAGASAIITQGTQVFTCKDLYHDMPLPGGGIERGETPETAVVREVAEEVSLNVGVKRLVACWIRPASLMGLNDYHFFYECTLEGPYEPKEDPSEIVPGSSKFVDPEAVKGPSVCKLILDHLFKSGKPGRAILGDGSHLHLF